MWLWLEQRAEKQLVQVWATASRIGPTVVQALVTMPSPGRILAWHALGAPSSLQELQELAKLTRALGVKYNFVLR